MSPRARTAAVPGRGAALALLGVAALWALALPGARLGLGLVVACAAVGVAAALAARTGRAGVESSLRAPTGPRATTRRAWWLLGAALAAQAALRDDATLVAVDLLGAGWAATLALGGAARWPAVLRAAAGPLRAPVRGFGLAWSAVGGLVPRRAGAATGPLARGAALAVLLVGAFGALFVSADGAFAQLAGETLATDLDADDLLGRAALALLALALTGGLLVAAAPARLGPGAPWPPTRRGLERAEWAPPLAALVVLFALFVAVQLSVLFGGRAYVLETTGLGYGEYARKGFLQLLVTTGLTLAVVAAAVRLARREDPWDERLLRGLLAVLLLLTGVVLASALHRLQLVEAAYGFTRVRLAGHAVVLVLGGLVALVLLAGVARPVARRLPRLAAALALTGLLAHSASAPDGRIAEENVGRLERTGQFDAGYAAGLGAEAVPALTRLRGEALRCVTATQRARLGEDDGGWAGSNRARERARDALARVPAAGAEPACAADRFAW